MTKPEMQPYKFFIGPYIFVKVQAKNDPHRFYIYVYVAEGEQVATLDCMWPLATNNNEIHVAAGEWVANEAMQTLSDAVRAVLTGSVTT